MSRKKVILIWLTIFSPFIGLFLVIYLTSIGIFGPLPTFEQLESPKNNLATEIISEDGVLLGTYFLENRSNIKHHELPQNLINALISTEDIRYMSHSGIDVRSLARAIFGLISGVESSGGASTITQQLARTMYDKIIRQDRSIIRKIKELITALNIEQTYTKSEILELYLNSVYFGHRRSGVQSASKYYFGKDVS